MNADEERIRIARIKYCTRSERTPWKTFLCCALGRKHACEYIDEFPHVIESFLSRELQAGRELYDLGMYGYKSEEYALTDCMVNPSARSLQDPGRLINLRGDTVESLRNNERVQQPTEEVSLNPKRQLRAYVALICVALFAVALALSRGGRFGRVFGSEDDQLCRGVWSDRGERQVVRAGRRGWGNDGNSRRGVLRAHVRHRDGRGLCPLQVPG